MPARGKTMVIAVIALIAIIAGGAYVTRHADSSTPSSTGMTMPGGSTMPETGMTTTTP